MDDVYTIVKDFGCVPCGIRTVETVKIENKTDKAQVLEFRQERTQYELFCDKLVKSRLQIQPNTAVVQPKQSVSVKLIYLSYTEDITDNLSYNIFDAERLIGRLRIHAKSVGPFLESMVYHLKFFRFREVNETVKNIEITNTGNQDAKFYFDIDEDSQLLEISHTRGVIPKGFKFGLKIKFHPPEPGVYYKKIFCIIQYHSPIIFNILGVYKPKVKLHPKNLTFRYPHEIEHRNNYEAYFYRENTDRLPEPDKSLHKCIEDNDINEAMNTEEEEMEKYWSILPEPPPKVENKQEVRELFLSSDFVNMKNSTEAPKATSLVNPSKSLLYYYEWDHDPKNNFQIAPCKGFIKPSTKIDFTIYFTPSILDNIYHTEADLKIFICNEEETESSSTIDLPVTMTLRIIGHSFSDNCCGWVPQCRITPKIIQMRSCVPDERVYATFILEREGHLPVTYTVLPSKNSNFTVHPPMAYLSKSFQLFIVQFNSHLKDPGIYTEDLIIKYNQSDLNTETVKLIISVEIPRLLFGNDNSVTFAPVFPGSKISATVTIENPTNLDLCYEFKIPEELDWIDIVDPTGLIDPKGFSEVTIIFKPSYPCEYMDYVPCYVSSAHKSNYHEIMRLQVIGSCQYGYLVATPSIHDFGESIYKKEKKIDIHLFNFSSNMLYFRLTVVNSSFPPGDVDTDVQVNPGRGHVPAKCSLRVEVQIVPSNTGSFEYMIQCQNFNDDSDEAEPCDDPRTVLLLKFEGVFPYIQIVDLNINEAGPVFSSDLLWKMLNVDKINKALRSLKSYHVIDVNTPEVLMSRNQISVAFLVQSNKYGSTKWSVTALTHCPCNETLSKNTFPSCWHIQGISVQPSKFLTPASEKSILVLNFHYNFLNELSTSLVINLPNKKRVVVKMRLVSLPAEPPTFLSTYFKSPFILRPVFIGDPHPPVQLFWLYNNTKEAASYSLDVEVLQREHKNIFDCINPEGTVQPFSSSPLKIIFAPTELIEYSVEVPIHLGKMRQFVLQIKGEGKLQLEPFRVMAITNVLPKAPIMRTEDLQCCENFINIPVIGLHSRMKHMFFLKNSSKTECWFFQWTNCKFDNIFSVLIKPEKGIVEPCKKVPLTLFIKTYCHPSSFSYSVPCEILNYSQLTVYRDWLRMQEMVEERDTQYFTITDRGTSHASTKMAKRPKPISRHIFVTLNVNIVSNLLKDMILDYKCQYIPIAEKEIDRTKHRTSPLPPKMLQPTQGLLEKLLWDILCQHSVMRKIKQKSQDFIYKQIMPESLKKKTEMTTFLSRLPSKNLVQELLESTIHEFLSKNYAPHKCKKINEDFQFQSNMYIQQDL